MRILLAVDGSPESTRAARYAGRLAKELRKAPLLTLAHVDAPLLQSVAVQLGVHAMARYHAENSAVATKAAKYALKRLGIAHDVLLLVGDPAATIVKHAKAGKFDLIVMGSHGRGAIKSLFLGSVATKVLSQSLAPVVLVR